MEKQEKPTLPKGTRDFGPAQMAKRQFIFDSIKKVFQKYGFQPLETPAMENLSTLTGKYGDEGDQLLFKVLDSGDFFRSIREKITPILGARARNCFSELLDRINHELGSNKKASEEEYIVLINHLMPIISTQLIIDASEIDIIQNYLIFRSNFVASKIQEWYANVESELNITEIEIAKRHFFIRNLMVNDIVLDLFDFITKKNKAIDSRGITRDISEKGLRYDLTVPFARYVVLNRHEIALPFKRYQMQPVWRADKPQKGRYREFYQCDADVVGTDSMICEAEIILMIKEVFSALGIADYTVKVNHRGILSGLAELTGTPNETALFVAIDKLDKIGEQKVREELVAKGFTTQSLDTVFEILNYKGTTAEKIKLLTDRFTTSASGTKGITDFSAVLQLLTDYGVNDEHVEFDIALARGLSYYTGCIFEVKISNVAIGSVSGGGRYDNLTQAFGAKERLSGVGISFGIDRIYDCMDELKLFPESTQASSKVLICHFDEESKRYGLKALSALRNSGIASEIYPDTVKINKQLDYANKKMIPYTIVIGSDEVKSGVLSFKDMSKGEQSKLSIEEILNKLTVDNWQ